MMLKIKVFVLIIYLPVVCAAQVVFEDSFDDNLSGWELNKPKSVEIIDSQGSEQGKVLVLKTNGNVLALIKNSDKWGSVSVEGKMYFPKKENNYLGFVYNYEKTNKREDFGLLYVKGNSSYIRVNPWRDGNVSRLLYEEYKTNLEGDQAIQIGKWHSFRMEVVNETCHLYMNDMQKPKITFNLFEGKLGKIGFQPRVTGGNVWIDDIKVTKIKDFTYKGSNIPNIKYEPDLLLTNWEVIGPLPKPNLQIELLENYNDILLDEDCKTINWQDFKTDARGALITGKITEYQGENTVAYFRTILNSEEAKTVTLHFTTSDELALYLNGKDIGRIYRDGYVSKDNDWNAWYDFYKNPNHKGRKKKIALKKGENQLIIRVRNGQFASGGFFVHLENI